VIGATLFSGIGCAEFAMPWVDWRWQAEIDPFASAVLRHRFPGVPNLGDVTAPDFLERAAAMGPLDVLVGGPPCVAFSVAGLRRSLDDPRGNLTLRWVQAIHATDPVWCVTENVPGWLSTKDNAFGCFLAGLVGADAPLVPPRECGGRWTDAGMVAGPVRTAAWRIICAQYHGVAQRRRRVFVVSGRTGDGANPGAVLFVEEGVLGDTSPRGEAREGVTGGAEGGARSGGPTEFLSRSSRCYMPDGLAPAVQATGARNGNRAPQVCAGIPHTVGALASNGGTARGLGIGAPTPIPGHGMGQQDWESGYAIPVCSVALHGKRGGNMPYLGGDTALTVRASQGGADKPHVLAYGGNNTSGRIDVATALSAHGGSHGRLDFETETFVVAPLSTAGCEGNRSGMMVRRLTPNEREKLMGLPDDWTDIPCRGRLHAPDGPRYRAIGNGLAVPVVAWIGNRLREVDAAMRGEGWRP
jgi:DNA (cytosine-5)-methyltransferase 1